MAPIGRRLVGPDARGGLPRQDRRHRLGRGYRSQRHSEVQSDLSGDGGEHLYLHAQPQHRKPVVWRPVRRRLRRGSLGLRIDHRLRPATRSLQARRRSHRHRRRQRRSLCRWESNGYFFSGLAKYDGYSVKQKNQAPAFEVGFDGGTFGAEVQGGYRWTNGATFVEPVVSVSWTSTSLDSFSNAQAGAQVSMNPGDSVYGNAGLRVGTTAAYGEWTVTPYAGAYVQGEMAGKNSATVTAGASALTFADPRGGANGRFELGLSGHGRAGLELSAAIDGVTGGSLSGVSGRVGLAYHW